MANRQYIGARYVPLIDGEWNANKKYEALTVVTYLNNSYTSKKPVPVGVDPTNTEYWALTGNYNAQITDFSEQLEQFREEFDEITEKLKKINIVSVGEYGAKGDGITDDFRAIQDCIDNNPNSMIMFNGVYLISSGLKIPTSYNIVLNLNGSTIRATTQMRMVQFLTTYVPKPLPDNLYTHAQFYGVTGGVLDGAGLAAVGLENNDNRGVYNDLKIIDCTYAAIYENSEGNDIAGITFYNNIAITQQRYSVKWSEGDTIGIILNGQDCRLSNISIMREHVGIKMTRSGHIITNLYIYGQGNLTLNPDLQWDSYEDWGIILYDSPLWNVPLTMTNVYFDTLKCGIWNMSDNTNWRVDITNMLMYSDSFDFGTRRQLYLLGGQACEMKIDGVRVYNNELTTFYKGEWTNTDAITDNYTRINVTPNAGYWDDPPMNLATLNIPETYTQYNMQAGQYYVLTRLATTIATGLGKWKVDVNLRGIQDMSFTCAKYDDSGIHILRVNNDSGNLIYDLYLDTELRQLTLNNGNKMYYYNVYIKPKQDDNLWVSATCYGYKPFSSAYTPTYYHDTPAATGVNPAMLKQITVLSGDIYYDLSGGVIATTIQPKNFVYKNYKLTGQTLASNEMKFFAIPNPTPQVITALSIVSSWCSNDACFVAKWAVNAADNELRVMVYNTSTAEVTTDIDVYIVFTEFLG